MAANCNGAWDTRFAGLGSHFANCLGRQNKLTDENRVEYKVTFEDDEQVGVAVDRERL